MSVQNWTEVGKPKVDWLLCPNHRLGREKGKISEAKGQEELEDCDVDILVSIYGQRFEEDAGSR